MNDELTAKDLEDNIHALIKCILPINPNLEYLNDEENFYSKYNSKDFYSADMVIDGFGLKID